MRKNSSTQGARAPGDADPGSAAPCRRSVLAVARLGVAVVALALLGACGLIKIGYRNADTVGLLYFNRYLDLASEQKDYVRPKLRQFVAWHRKTQLPDYAAFAAELRERAARDITPAEVLVLQDEMRDRAETMVQHAAPDIAEIALRLTPANLQALRDRFEDNDDKFRDEMMKGDVERQQKARYDKVLDRAEEWYGRFSREQRAQIRRLSDARPMDNEILLSVRQRRQKDAVDLLARIQRDKPPRDQVIGSLKAYDRQFDLSPDPKERAFQESLRRATAEMDAAIHNLSTPEQRARVASKLQDWIETFNDLGKG